MALATSNTFLASGVRAGGPPEEVLGFLELGFQPSVRTTPGLAKHETGPLNRFTASRLVASIRLANERLFKPSDDTTATVANSLVATCATDNGVTVVACGFDATCWHVRGNRFQWLVEGEYAEQPSEDLEWIGRRPEVEPTVLDVELEPGDLVGLGRVDPQVIEILTNRALPLADALGRCLAESPLGLLGLVCVLGRWSP